MLTDGERWTRGALRELRAQRFTPLAWARFLGASFARSWADARARPDLERQALAVGAVGGAAWAAIALAVRSGWWGLAWWALVVAMLWSHLGMVQGPRGEYRGGLGFPNLLTLGRAWLAPLPAFLVGDPWAFAAVLAVAFATDALDGPLARARGRTTRFGIQADAMVDAALVLVAVWSAQGAGWVPLWVAVLVSARYAVSPLLVAIHYFARASAPSPRDYVSGRLPGVAVAVGLLLSAAHELRAAGVILVVVGVVAGLATTGVSASRALRAS